MPDQDTSEPDNAGADHGVPADLVEMFEMREFKRLTGERSDDQEEES